MSSVAEFSIPYYQILNPEGQLSQPLPEFAKDSEVLKKLYYFMSFTRAFDTKAVTLQRTGKMGTYPSSLGQEAVSVGIGHALQKDDVFVPYYRDQGTLIMRGVQPSQIFAYWGGDERGSDFEINKEDFPTCVPIATQYLHAAGIAYAIKYRKQNRAVLTICGDGGTSEGDFYEGINAAGSFNLPVVFIVNNNQWAISVPRDAQTSAKTLAQKAIASGFEGIQIDGNDVLAVRHYVSEALNKARKGNGPTLIEAVNYRLCDHTTADDAKRYCPKESLDEAWQYEPLLRMRKYLNQQGHWNEEEEHSLQNKINHEVATAVEEYLNMQAQAPTAMFDYLYHELPVAYQEQYQELLHIDLQNISH